MQSNTEGLTDYPAPEMAVPRKRGISAFFAKNRPELDRSSLVYFNSEPLYRLGHPQEHYARILRKKDLRHIGPIVKYFIGSSGQRDLFLGGAAVKSLCHQGKRRYKVISILALLDAADIEKYAFVLNNIISSSDGAFAMGFRYRVKKNRTEGCFREIATARYIIEPRFEGLKKLLLPFRPASIEIDLTTRNRFSSAAGIAVP